MSKLTWERRALNVFLLCAATAVSSPAQQIFTQLVSFNGTNGANPSLESLVQGPDGNFYGTTVNGYNSSPLNDDGNVFRISPGGALTTLYNFCAQNKCADGDQPTAGLVLATDGNFYGTTSLGGVYDHGTVFKITPGGTVTTSLYNFDLTDGSYPNAGLVQAADGNFYGTTPQGGTSSNCSGGCGTIFKITPGGTLTTLHSFNGSDGTGPVGGLAQAADGNFYGTTFLGGGSSLGTVFKITPTGTLTTLHTFVGRPTDGSLPSRLMQATDGNFYGTTSNGGANNQGTVFKITPGGTLTILYSFVGYPTDGQAPSSGVIQATDGNFYGTTSYGGGLGGGSIFRITPGGTLTTLYSFCPGTNCTSGTVPNPGRLLQATDGNFYGATYSGGANGLGTVYRLSEGLSPFVKTIPTSGVVGVAVIILGNNLTGATGVSFNGTPATFTLVSSSEIDTTVPAGATTGTVQVTTPSGTLDSNVAFQVRGLFTTSGDFDGDGKADVAVWRPSNGDWFIIPSSNPTTAIIQQWGTQGDIPVRGDYDGDGKTDIAVFRPSTGIWFIIPSSNPGSPIIRQWGTSGDIPVPGDYDGDGITDIAVFRPSTGIWFIIPSSNPSSPILRQWGTSGDIPVPGDYDGDGKTDIAVWRPSTGIWFIIPSGNPGSPIIRQWGTSGDMPVPGDYDVDGITDIAVWRPSSGIWFVIPSSNPSSPIIRQWGTSGDIPVPVDYDGDGKTDIAVWRPSNGLWFVIPSSAPSTFTITQWGASTDVPVQKPIGQ